MQIELPTLWLLFLFPIKSYIEFKTKYNSKIETVVTNKLKYPSNSRSREVTRLRRGKYFLNAYIFEIGKHANDLCINCKLPETVEHYLLKYSNSTLNKQLNCYCKTEKIHLGIETALSDHRLNNIIVKYLDRKI